MTEIVTHTGQQLQTAVRQVWVYCAREAEIQDNLGQRVWLSDHVIVKKLNSGIRSDLDALGNIAGSSNNVEVRITVAGVMWV